ncbi:hypothetical protein [Dialister invisus]|uniref:hypothetical protein n=1 Tax=Dialister invisus TaxID=218538 RepID=UPI00399EEF8D
MEETAAEKKRGTMILKTMILKKEEKAFFLFCRRDCAIMEQILLSFGLTVHIFE